jgi:hypothetical protein
MLKSCCLKGDRCRFSEVIRERIQDNLDQNLEASRKKT